MYRLEVHKDYDKHEKVITHYDFDALIELFKFITNNDDYNYKVFIRRRCIT